MEVGIFSAVDFAHSALTQLFDDPVMRDALADHGEGPRWQSAFCILKHLKLGCYILRIPSAIGEFAAFAASPNGPKCVNYPETACDFSGSGSPESGYSAAQDSRIGGIWSRR